MKLLALYTDQKEIQFKNLSTSFSEIFEEEKHYISHAKKFFHNYKTLFASQFEEVAWREVYDILHGIPKLFVLWA